jgi:hypothetical protein
VDKLKDKETNPDSKSDPENIENRQIIDTYPTAIFVIATIQPKEPIDPKEGECLFHSKMWVNGTPLHLLIVATIRNLS